MRRTKGAPCGAVSHSPSAGPSFVPFPGFCRVRRLRPVVLFTSLRTRRRILMAFLCSADSGNLMAVAQQLINQQQQKNRQPEETTHQAQIPDENSFWNFHDPFLEDEWIESFLLSNSWDNPPLLESLFHCARLLDSDPGSVPAQSLARIGASSSESGDPAERVGFYFCKAFELSPSRFDFSPEELILCYKALDDACPYTKFAHLTANQAILESTAAAERIHVIDFGFAEGVQWAPLLQALSTRPSGKPAKVRLSGVVRAGSEPAAGDRLRRFAAELGLDFEFQAVGPAGLRVCAGEAVAVNFMLQLSQRSEPVDQVLGLAKALGPTVVTLGEYEYEGNEAGEEVGDRTRALSHHAAWFESLEPGMDRGSADRRLVEGRLLGPRLMAAVGPAETRPRMRGKAQWRAIMERTGFETEPLSHYAVSQARILLWNYNYSENFSLVDSEPGFLSLAWRGQPLLSVSSWR